MKYLIFVSVILILFMSLAQAEFQHIGTYGEDYDVKRSCTFNGTDCSGSAVCNITITYPDQTNLIKNVRMTNQGSFHNYTLLGDKINQLEYYTVHMVCDDGGLYGTEDFQFQVTGNGKPNASGGVVVLFSVMFIILVGITCYLSIYTIGHFLSLDFDLVDLAFDWGVFFAILTAYSLEMYYLGNLGIEAYFKWFLLIGGLLLVVIPIVAFIFSITIGSLSKRKVQSTAAPTKIRLRRVR